MIVAISKTITGDNDRIFPFLYTRLFWFGLLGMKDGELHFSFLIAIATTTLLVLQVTDIQIKPMSVAKQESNVLIAALKCKREESR